VKRAYRRTRPDPCGTRDRNFSSWPR